MPRNVRNFWIEAEVDGRKTPIAFGPQGEDGGFRLSIRIRNEGQVEEVVLIDGMRIGGGILKLWIECKGAKSASLERFR